MKKTSVLGKIASAIGIFAVIFGFSSCNGVNAKTIKRVQMMEEGVSNPSTIEELSSAIKKYEKRSADLIAAQEQTGTWYKILATRYLDNGMYAEALDALEHAIHYYPTNQNLFYYVGVSAGQMANASLDFKATGNSSERTRYLLLAESAFLQALQLEPTYVRALYSLGVLYTCDMDQPLKAIPYLEKLLTIDTKHTDAMMVLARAHYQLYNYDAAVTYYDQVISTSGDKQKVANATYNKKVVLDAAYN